LILLFLCGPRPASYTLDPQLPTLPENPTALENLILRQESALPVREDNHSRLIWLHPEKRRRTPLAMLYLHGFSASWFEGDPLHRDLCRELGMNLYLPRLAAHGLETADPLLELRPDNLYRSASEALALTKMIGERVIIAATSTGATLALMLAAHHPDKIAGLLLFSPNIRLADSSARLLTWPWGLQLAHLITGSSFRDSGDRDPVTQPYWYSRTRLEGIAAMQQLLEDQMVPDTFRRIRCPVFMGYYHRNKKNQDKTVSVPAMLDMFDKLGTPTALKVKAAFPDAGVHVIASKHINKNYDRVYREALGFLKTRFFTDSPGQPMDKTSTN
jgi:pimeloyl-ACP methyl ester carboxylesterase